jgi:hypothetical protein
MVRFFFHERSAVQIYVTKIRFRGIFEPERSVRKRRKKKVGRNYDVHVHNLCPSGNIIRVVKMQRNLKEWQDTAAVI